LPPGRPSLTVKTNHPVRDSEPLSGKKRVRLPFLLLFLHSMIPGSQRHQ
jgi:hypothetical protein